MKEEEIKEEEVKEVTDQVETFESNLKKKLPKAKKNEPVQEGKGDWRRVIDLNYYYL